MLRFQSASMASSTRKGLCTLSTLSAPPSAWFKSTLSMGKPLVSQSSSATPPSAMILRSAKVQHLSRLIRRIRWSDLCQIELKCPLQVEQTLRFRRVSLLPLLDEHVMMITLFTSLQAVASPIQSMECTRKEARLLLFECRRARNSPVGAEHITHGSPSVRTDFHTSYLPTRIFSCNLKDQNIFLYVCSHDCTSGEMHT